MMAEDHLVEKSNFGWKESKNEGQLQKLINSGPERINKILLI